MRRFPHSEVARNARAETLRDLGRYEEALAAFEETMRGFPQDEVAPTARGETLRDLGRYEEALAAFEAAMRRFPRNEVAPNARAETLRDLGRFEEALAAFWETMRRFPHNEVAPNARAETLRDLGRFEEALAVYEETMRRFPRNSVALNAYAHLLGQLGRIDDCERLLAPAANRSLTREDWIAAHILAMAQLRVGRSDQALTEFERGARVCKYRDVRRYFETARPLALLANRRAAEAVQQLEALAKEPLLPREDVTNIVLFQAHALAEVGESRRAKALVESAQIVDLATARQMRLAVALAERYGLTPVGPASGTRAQQLNQDIATLEFELEQIPIMLQHSLHGGNSSRIRVR
jgi:tetratricopeptide (TPR) repeat protein